ncbi:hypothetical protein ACEUZ9_000755 [Paracoccus litorisediminis]|uniref:hypothetical protein n=1 Tax=Paracoccus litorisediminis TaxID=2006130 RepID=UPI00373199C2
MPEFCNIDLVWHVGTLERADRGRKSQESYEGHLFSVSEFPEDWSDITHLSGEVWEMTREGAEWLDIHALNEDELAEIRAWAIDARLAVTAPVFRTWRFDSEGGSWGYCEFTDQSDALAEIEGEELGAADDIPSQSGGLLDEVAGIILTPEGREAIGRWRGATHADDALVILWADLVLKPEHPDLMGVWWYDDHDPAALSCPRGGVFEDRLGEFTFDGERGASPPESFLERHFTAATFSQNLD